MIILIILSLIIPGNFGQYSYETGLDTINGFVKKADLRSAMASKLDPNFWPARGRKRTIDVDELFQSSPNYLDIPILHRRENLDAGTFANRGRKNDDEETGVFWAGRGRDLTHESRSPENEPDGTFWANRGRALDEENLYDGSNNEISKDEKPDGNQPDQPNDDATEEIDTRWRRHRLFVEEPGWVWLARREAHPGFDVSFAGSSSGPFVPQDKGKIDLFWVARGKKHEKQKREISRFRPDPCWSFHMKRSTKNVMRELSQLTPNRFWPARGKKTMSKRTSLDLVAKHLAGADRGSFWPARGKRPVSDENSSREKKEEESSQVLKSF